LSRPKPTRVAEPIEEEEEEEILYFFQAYLLNIYMLLVSYLRDIHVLPNSSSKW